MALQAGASAAELMCSHLLKQLLACALPLSSLTKCHTASLTPQGIWRVLAGTCPPAGRLCTAFALAAGAHAALTTLRSFLQACTTLALQRRLRLRVLEVLLCQDVSFYWRCELRMRQTAGTLL